MKEKTNKESTHQKGGMTYRSSSRRNGWTCPPHPLQFVAWIFIAFFAVMFHGMAVPAIPYHWQPACHMIVGITLAVHVVTHLVCLSIDPADPSTFRRQKKVMPTFDRMQHNHVIENNHCYLCEVDVGVKSKHCSSCNKCVADFDHHCKWLNNCVGSRNYRWFITCLSSSFLSCLFVFIVFLYLSVVYWVNPRLLHPDLFDGATTTQANFLTSQPPTGQLSSNSTSPYNSDTTPDPLEVYRGGLDIFRPVPGIAFFVVSIVIAVLLLLTLCLLGHLLGFHLYLMCKGMTTYDYVVQDRSAITGRDVEAQQQQARQKGCCKCNNQVVPLPKEKEDMELTETKKDTTSQLESNNNSNGNLQQQLVVAEPLIKQEQQQEQQQQQVEMGAAVIDSKPKVKRKKKAKRKPPRMRPLTTRDKLQPALMEHPYPALMNPAHSMPQTYLEQHLVRRFSLPLVAAHGMHPKYPQGEPVEDLFFTQQFPTMQQPVVTPQGGLNPRRQLPLPAAISFDSPTPALDYHSSSAESLTEVPLGPSRRSNPAQRGMLPSSGHQVVSGYQQPLDKWQPNHNSHPNLMMNDNQWQPDAEQWPIERLVDVNVKSDPCVQKATRKGQVKPEDVSTGAKVLDRTERQRRDSKLEPLLIKTAHLPEGHEPPSATVCQTDRNTGKNSKRKPKKQASPVETTADVHQELDHHERLPQNSSNKNTQDTSKPEAQEVPDSYTKPELGSHGQQEAPPVPPVAPPRRRALKLGLEPSSHSGSQSSLQSSSSHQHLLEAEDRSSKPPRKTRKGDLKDANQHDAVSLPGSIPEVPPLDLTPLMDTRNSDMGSVADREPSGGEGSLSDDELVEGCSSPAKSLDPLRPMASRRSLLLRY